MGAVGEALEKLQKVLEAFQGSSGINLNQYTSLEQASRQGLAFKEWQKSERDLEHYRSSLQMLKEQAQRVLTSITMSLENQV